MKKLSLFLFILILHCALCTEQCRAQSKQLWGMTRTGGEYDGGVIFSTDSSATNQTVQHSFYVVPGREPEYSHLIQASDGNLYGMTASGGAYNKGILFQYNLSDSTLTKKIDFAGASNGATPYGSLMQASDGNLYGMTRYGGTNDLGVLFQYNPSTAVLTKKIDFTWAKGRSPFGSLIQASDGNLYGMTFQGGANDDGVLFRYNLSTTVLTIMIDFAGANGQYPYGALLQASDGYLYGMTLEGGTDSSGVLFRYNLSDSVLTKMIDFKGAANGRFPCNSLIQASDGNLYSVTQAGGKDDYGVLFRYNPSNSELTKMFDFKHAGGVFPWGDLVQAADGFLYGMTMAGGAGGSGLDGVLFRYNLSDSTYTKKIDFGLQDTDGSQPHGSLMQASDGNLYGMTRDGGTGESGILFRYNTSTSTLTKKIDFGGGPNGQYPYGSLMHASDGNLYGMTSNGGADGIGVLFQYNPSNSGYTSKVDFTNANGASPTGALVQASDGNLYGMTLRGGASDGGILFQYNPSTSVLTKKIDFSQTSTGVYPWGSLLQASDGNLYGMIYAGGANDGGTLFQYNPSTSTFTKKIDFAGTDGANPQGSLIEASDGNLYGMTYAGGTDSAGVLFRYNPSTSILTKMIDFTGANGKNPYASLVQASDGNLYGLTLKGGANNKGVLFQYNLSDSTLTKKIDFAGTSNGATPYGSLVLASDGYLYGVTELGGTNNYGILFQYNTTTSMLTKKLDFNKANGQAPYADLIEMDAIITSAPAGAVNLSTVVYPNPSTGLFNISNVLVNSQLTVTNIWGELIYHAKVTGPQVQVDLSKEAKGIYFIQIADADKNIIYKKIIKQ